MRSSAQNNTGLGSSPTGRALPDRAARRKRPGVPSSDTKRPLPRTDVLRHALLSERYLLKNDQGRVMESHIEMFRRVAEAIAEAEAAYGLGGLGVAGVFSPFFQLMATGQFLPNSPTLMSAGRKGAVLSACFVLPVNDSVEEIFESVKDAALVQKAGGGTGFSFDRLRPTGDHVVSSGGTTSGPMSFMHVFGEGTSAIQQGASRRGANMGMMSVTHPDILKFITAKAQTGGLENFNLSVKVSDAFMQTLKDRPDEPHFVTNPRDGKKYLIPRDVDIRRYGIQDLLPAGTATKPCFTARDVWDRIVACAHAVGEPGLCFIDRVNRDNPTPALGRIEATNPCGEQPLLDYEACTLGSINLARFVDRKARRIRWGQLRNAIWWAINFLDDVIDVATYPLPRIEQVTRGNRKIGLGIMGFADALMLLGIRYNSPEAVRLAEEVGRLLSQNAHKTSEKLAADKGCFPNWAGSTWDTEYHRPMRNATCTTIAPTGSISILADCSSGIEPIFRVVVKRRVLGKEFLQIHPLVEQLGSRQGWMNRRVRAALLKGRPPREVCGFPRELADLLVTAHEVSPEWHVRVQAAFQKHIDNAVSKTVNLPAAATVADVDKTFRLAYELGCKGITVYRDDSQPDQTISLPPRRSGTQMSGGICPRPRPPVAQGRTYKFRMGCGTLFVTVNRDDQGLCEVFANLGKAGGCPSQTEATCRAVSAALRSGVDPRVLIEQLKDIRCLSTCMARQAKDGVEVLSCPDAIARAIEAFSGGLPEDSAAPKPVPARVCPVCQRPVRREAGCFVCDNCFWNGCGYGVR